MNEKVAVEYGKVARKCVMPRGESGLEDEVEYVDVENYLKAL